MWKLHRKLNFHNIFRLAAIYTWAPAFKLTERGKKVASYFYQYIAFFPKFYSFNQIIKRWNYY